ncbi:MAG: NFACT family protein, partial [Thiovulaceae bacterium]|nr:NFACT family protein [Sulfurimonadaceae bacterium]
MKLSHLRQIVSYMQDLKHINAIHRISDSVIKIVFDRDNIFYFNMQKGNAYISKCANEVRRSKVYGAPFDVILSKRFNRAQVEGIELYNDDKIIRIKASISGAYKAQSTVLQLEFTGKTTNAIILDEDEIIQEALRHVDAYSSYRIIKVGQELVPPPVIPFVPKEYPLEDVEAFLYAICEEEQTQRLTSIKKQRCAFIEKKIEKLARL